MPDIFDEIAGNASTASAPVGTPTGDIFDQIAGNVTIAPGTMMGSPSGMGGIGPMGDVVAPTAAKGDYFPRLFSSLISSKGLSTDAYNGTIGAVGGIGTALNKAWDSSQSDPTYSSLPSGVSQVAALIGNFYKDKTLTQGIYDTGKVASGVLPVIGPTLYDKIQQVVNPSVVPPTTPEQDASAIRTNAIGTGALYGLTKGVGAALTPESTLEKLTGYNPTKKAQIAGGLDAEGNFTSDMSKAVEQVSKQDLKYQDLVDSGFPDKITAIDTPKSVALKLSQFKEQAGKTIGDTLDEASKLEQNFFNSGELSPAEKGAYMANTSPHFGDAQEFVDSAKTVNESLGSTLDKKLNTIMESWNSSDQTLMDLQKLKQKYGLVNKKSFNPMASTEEQAAQTLDNLIYSDLAQNVKGKIEQLDPALGKTLEEANKSYSAAATFENPAFNASRKSGLNTLASDFSSIHGKGVGLLAAGGSASLIPGVGQIAAPIVAGLAAIKAAKDIAPVQTMLLGNFLKDNAGALAVTPQAVNNLTNNTKPSDNKANLISKFLSVPEADATDYSPAKPDLSSLIGKVTGKMEDIKAPVVEEAPDMFKGKPEKQVLEAIKSNPTDHAIALLESGLDPKAKNPNSSATGLFQLIKGTAKNLGVEDPTNAGDNYDGYLKLKAQAIKNFKSDTPQMIYANHYLGQTVLRKWINGDKLTPTQAAQVKELETVLLPRLTKIYNGLLKENQSTEA